MLARLLLVRSLKSVTLGNRVAVKGTLRRGLRSSFVREEFLLIHGLFGAENDLEHHAKLHQKESQLANIPETKNGLNC
jgi:hypothetical protein